MLRYSHSTDLTTYAWIFALFGVPVLLMDRYFPIGGFLAISLVPFMVWRRGVTLDLKAKQVRVWQGPLVGLISTSHPLTGYAIVSVMNDSVENFHDNRPFTRTYSTSLTMKLQPRLEPDTQFPEDLPPTITLRGFGSPQKARIAGAALAEQLGMEFRSDF